MSDNAASWFARKLGVQPQQPQGYTQQPVQYPQAPPQQFQPQWQGQVPQNVPQQHVDPSVTGQAVFAAFKNKQAGVTLMDVANQWRGDRKRGAARLETENCPECDSPNYFTRQSVRSKRTGCAPAPLCMNCGYNGGMFEQYGTTAVPDAEED